MGLVRRGRYKTNFHDQIQLDDGSDTEDDREGRRKMISNFQFYEENTIEGNDAGGKGTRKDG